jgi:hypothetical protein
MIGDCRLEKFEVRARSENLLAGTELTRAINGTPGGALFGLTPAETDYQLTD